MNFEKAILLGVITAYAALSYAQVTRVNRTNNKGPTAKADTIAYREVLWTNIFEQHYPDKETLAEIPFNEIDFTIPTNDVSAAWSNDYQVIVLLQDEDMSGPAENEQDTAFTTNLNASLLSQLTADELLQWQYGGTKTERNPSNQKGTKRTPTQILIIEPLNSLRGDTPGPIKVHEYRLDTVHPKPEWHEWFNPRMFLEKWAGYWSSETNATPVVLVLFTF